MKLGMFMMPVNDHRRDTHVVLKEDVEIAVKCDDLGFNEFWIGEHYTTLSEPVSCPFTFLANLIARTKTIKLCTGVVNLPQRHPAQIAAHAAMLDHLSDGRLIMGVSPGGLVSDFEIFGVTDLKVRREMANECIDAVLKLWESKPPYDISGKYWNIKLDKHSYPELGIGELIKPYQHPHPPLVASAMSPNSGSVHTAAIRGWGVISANFVPTSTIKTHWDGFRESCKEIGRLPVPNDWRVARTIYVAPSDSEAEEYITDRSGPFPHYFGYLVDLIKRAEFHAIMKEDVDMPDELLTWEYACDNFIIAGSPETVAEKIINLRQDIGPFGTILMTAADLQGPDHKQKLIHSMDLMAQRVMPIIREGID